MSTIINVLGGNGGCNPASFPGGGCGGFGPQQCSEPCESVQLSNPAQCNLNGQQGWPHHGHHGHHQWGQQQGGQCGQGRPHGRHGEFGHHRPNFGNQGGFGGQGFGGFHRGFGRC